MDFITSTPMLTLRAPAFQNNSANLCGVEVFFDSNGIGNTPSYNRQYIETFQNLRQGVVTILKDEAFEEVVEERTDPVEVQTAVSPEAIDEQLSNIKTEDDLKAVLDSLESNTPVEDSEDLPDDVKELFDIPAGETVVEKPRKSGRPKKS